MKRIGKLILVGFIFLTNSGCWDVKNVQFFNFVNAIGIDYVEGKFKVYAQFNEFASMAKQEGAGQVKDPITIGKGEGESIGLAMFDLQKASQMRTDWTQNKVFIFSNRALEKGLLELEDELMRTRDQRYTPWVFTTNEQLEKVLNIKPVNGTTSIATLIYQPNYLYKQQSTIEPLHYQKFIRSSREPYDTILLSQIGINKDWIKGDKNIPLAVVKGGVAVSKGKSQGEFSLDDITGVKWLNEKTFRGILPVKDDSGELVGSVALETNKVTKKPKYKDGKRIIVVQIKLSGELREQRKNMQLNELEALIEKNVVKEIENTYAVGKKRNVDLYSFNETWYRKGWEVEKDIPEPEVHVNVHLVHSNAFGLRK